MGAGDDKKILRRRIALLRDQVDGSREQAAEMVTGRVAGLGAFSRAETILTYAAFGTELDTAPMIRRILDTGRTLALPRVEDQGLTLWAVSDPKRELTPGTWGIPEPIAGLRPVTAWDVDLFLLPGLAFDRAGRRLGYGGGYFDRLLKGAPGFTVGIGFDFQVVDTVPAEPHDVRVDRVVTPSQNIRCPGDGAGAANETPS